MFKKKNVVVIFEKYNTLDILGIGIICVGVGYIAYNIGKFYGTLTATQNISESKNNDIAW